MTKLPIRFCFALRPPEEIYGWPQGGPEGPLYLPWFGLTDGWYWMEIGDKELFRYSDAIRAAWNEVNQPPYPAYPVVRFWEDMLQTLPYSLAPIPDTLAERITDQGAWANWLERAKEWSEGSSNEEAYAEQYDLYDNATSWWYDRQLSYGHMNYTPDLWFWRHGDTMHVRWDNRDDAYIWEGIPVLAVRGFGEIAMPVSVYLEAIRDFDNRLMAAMAEQLDNVRLGRHRPEVTIYLPDVDQDHAERTQHLNTILARTPHLREMDWDEVMDAITAIDTDPRFRANAS
jgi:hypothetical protein